ncbi:MAG: penicillin-binding protein, partial [Bacteroidales bacterium]|nr:penicillin-binding protein [Bacteroidales bacterium]
TPPVIMIGKDKTWSPTDAHANGAAMPRKWGLAASSNSLSAFLMQQFGPEAVVKQMHKMGINSHIEPVASLCVGSADLSVFEMVSAYNTFPSLGVYTYPMFVTRIEDSEGNVLGRYSPRRRESIGEIASYKMIGMMRGVVDGGTGGRLRGSKYGLKGDIAGKTGTTNDNSDGWFIAYTPNITAGAWVGGEDRYVHFNNGALGQGANMALPIWGIWMKKVLADGTLGISADDRFPEGANSSYCEGAVLLGGEHGGGAQGSEMEVLEDYYFE